MIAAIVVALLVCGALAFVTGPLRRGPDVEPASADPSLEAAMERKRAALSGLIDLEQERDSGKLSPADFEVLRLDYERDALRALQELDALKQDDALDDSFEKEIAAARDRLACPTCGALRPAGRPCPRCGA